MPGVPLHAFDLLEHSFKEAAHFPTTHQLPPTPPDDHAPTLGHLTPSQSAMGLPMTPDVTPPSHLMPPRPPLTRYPSSRADSFKTALENLSVNGSASALPQFDGAGDVQHPAKHHESHADLEKHISKGDDSDLDALAAVPPPAPLSPRYNGSTPLGFFNNLNVRKQRYRPSTPPEKAMMAREAREARRLSLLREHAATEESQRHSADANDLIYKQIQNFNVERFDALSNGNAVEAVVMPTTQTRNRQLRHVSKRHSLKGSDDGSIVSGSRRVSADDSYAGLPKSSLAMENVSPAQEKRVKREHTLRHPQMRVSLREHARLGRTEWQAETQGRSVTMPLPAGHALRHEIRPISSYGRPTESANAPTSLSPVTSPQCKLQESPVIQAPRQTLRHSSSPIRLSGDADKMTAMTYDSMKHELRRSSKDYRLENAFNHNRTLSGDNASYLDPANSPRSPPFLGLGAAYPLRKTFTPMSVSAVSDRTEMEVCEARNVTIFPHSNDSLLLVQHGSRPESKEKTAEIDQITAKGSPAPNNHLDIQDEELRVSPVFRATIDPPTPTLGSAPEHTVDSPLTKPRAPPIPPVIKCIPPTPNDEIEENPLTVYCTDGLSATPPKPTLQRRESIAKRARRYSDNLIQPLFSRSPSTRRHQVCRPPMVAAEKRDKHLHPFWEPGDIWQDYSDDEDYEPLPRGGDTSDHPRSRKLFSRSMSVRLPGFRGTGGFLVGNSLGMDRHGSNRRRHYVDLRPEHPLAQRRSQEMLSRLSSSSELRRAAGTHGGKVFSVPGLGGVRVQYVGLKGFREKMSRIRREKEDRERERRREDIRGSIGMRGFHGS